MTDLFAHGAATAPRMPLAARIRPRDLAEIVGQAHLLGPGKLLREAIEKDELVSCLLVGPPGSGKSTIGEAVAHRTNRVFRRLSAVESGVGELRRQAEEARDRSELYDQGTVLFIDEIHRLNRTQQDAILPYVEQGTFVLVGATTESPWRMISAPLLSRCRVFELERLSEAHILTLLHRALSELGRGLAHLSPQVAPEALALLAEQANGDARVALNALEAAVLTQEPGPDGMRHISLEAARRAAAQPYLMYDRQGDAHYDMASAFIKSMRGSDPDAALYWMARMLAGGEDPRFIARRIVIQAAEDVGLADPTALMVAVSAAQAVEMIGMPEAQIPLAQAVIHVASAPKSNSAYKAIAAAMEVAQQRAAADVPAHLKNLPAGGGRPQDYCYPHDHPGGWVQQSYLPPDLEGRTFYEPVARGREKRIAEWLAEFRAARDRREKAQNAEAEDGAAMNGRVREENEIRENRTP